MSEGIAGAAAAPQGAAPPIRTSAVAACYLYRAGVGLLAAAPLSLAFGAVVGGHPRGDAVLWEPGGVWLVESLRLVRPALGAALAYGGVVAVLAAFGWLLPLGVLIASLSSGRPNLRACLQRTAARLGTLALLLGLTWLLQAVVIVLTVVVSQLIAQGDAPVDLALRLGVWGLGAGICWAAACLQDLARIGCIHGDCGLWDSGARALLALRRSGLALGWAAAWRTAIALGALVGALGAGVVWARGDQLAALVLLHQAVIVWFVWLRAAWLQQAARRLASPWSPPSEGSV